MASGGNLEQILEDICKEWRRESDLREMLRLAKKLGFVITEVPSSEADNSRSGGGNPLGS